MTPDEREALKGAVTEVFEERRGIDADIHAAHHRFINEELEERQRKRERREKIREQVFGWGIITLLSGLIYSIGHFGVYLYEALKRGMHQ